MEEAETQALCAKLPHQQEALERQQQFPTNVQQQIAIGLFLGHLVVRTEGLGRTPGIARIGQVTQRAIELQHRLRTETSYETLARQAQAVTDSRDSHTGQRGAQTFRPVQAFERQFT